MDSVSGVSGAAPGVAKKLPGAMRTGEGVFSPYPDGLRGEGRSLMGVPIGSPGKLQIER